MKKILFAIAMMMSVSSFAQSDFVVSKDRENGAVVYKGQVTFADLSKEPTFGWFDRGVANYKPDTNAVKYLKKHLPKYEIVVFLGTWCDDSQNLIPKFYKLLQETGYPMAQVTMYGVDRAKTAKNVEHKIYKLGKVPTFIVYKNHVEQGRIEETVNKSIEVDLIKIIQPDVEKQEAMQGK